MRKHRRPLLKPSYPRDYNPTQILYKGARCRDDTFEYLITDQCSYLSRSLEFF